MKRTMLVALAAMAVSPAFAQGEGRNGLKYESAFKGFRPFQEQEVASWREVNDEVARVGGHIGVLKSGQEAKGRGKPEAKEGEAGAMMQGHESMQRGHQGMNGGAK